MQPIVVLEGHGSRLGYDEVGSDVVVGSVCLLMVYVLDSKLIDLYTTVVAS